MTGCGRQCPFDIPLESGRSALWLLATATARAFAEQHDDPSQARRQRAVDDNPGAIVPLTPVGLARPPGLRCSRDRFALGGWDQRRALRAMGCAGKPCSLAPGARAACRAQGAALGAAAGQEAGGRRWTGRPMVASGCRADQRLRRLFPWPNPWARERKLERCGSSPLTAQTEAVALRYVSLACSGRPAMLTSYAHRDVDSDGRLAGMTAAQSGS